MKKVFLISLIATMLLSVGVTNEVSAKEIAKTEVSKIEKSYSVTVETPTDAPVYTVVCLGMIQDDIYYLEQTSYGNYILPTFEEVCLDVDFTPPNITV